jgi:hypothetical protein
MKKYLLIAILLFSLLSIGYSQDKIITMNNDTIDCKINKISRNTIFFDVTTKSVKSSGKLPLSSVLNYTISGKATPEGLKAVNKDPFERLRLGMNGGPGYLLGSTKKAKDYLVSLGLTPDQVNSYYKDLKLGMNANADLTFLITPNFGAGIKYRFFDTSGSIEGFIDPQDGVHLFYTTYKEQIYVNYIGGMFFSQQFIGSRKSFKLNSACSFGLTTYRNEAGYLNGYYLLTGKNFGTDVSLGLEYFITSYFSVGVDLSAFYSSIRKVKLTDGTTTTTVDLDKEDYEDLSRLDISFGIRLYLWNK